MFDIDYTRYYKKWHTDTPEHIQIMKLVYADMLGNLLPQDKSIRILDVGCGMGYAMLALRDWGYENVEGIDIDSGQVQACLNKQLHVTQTDDSVAYLSRLPDTYDLILALDVIEHIPHTRQLEFVRAIQQALKPDGVFICTVPNANSALASRWRYNDWTHHLSFTEHSLDFLLYNAGFVDIQIFDTDFIHPPQVRWLSRRMLQKWFWKVIIRWCLFRFFRTFRRLELIAELDWEQARSIPLSLNLLARAVKPANPQLHL